MTHAHHTSNRTFERDRKQYLDKYISIATTAHTRVSMRIHNPNGFAIEWSEVQLHQCPFGYTTKERKINGKK